MIDVSTHYICVNPDILAHQWEKYKNAYRMVEARLPRFHAVPSPFIFKTHPLGGFLVRRDMCPSGLRKLFENESRKFLLQHGGRYYSRGLAYYPGLYKDLTNLEKIDFILTTIKEIVQVFEAEPDSLKKNLVYAAVAQDYIRNYLLILYHTFRLVAYRQNLIANDQEVLDQLNNQLKSVLLNTEIALFKYIIVKDNAATLPGGEIMRILDKLHQFFKTYTSLIDSDFVDKKLIREVREMDSLVHIFSFASMIADYRFHHNTVLVGLEYGGIELPFAVNAVRIMRQKQRVAEVMLRVSNYSYRSFVPKATDDIISFKTENGDIKAAKYIWVLDDSVSTGRSLHKVVQLIPQKAKIYVGVVAFKVSNRYHHLSMEEHGGLNPVVAKYSVMFCQANYSSTYRRNSYLNRSGIFDVNKYNLYKMLGKELL